MKNSNVIGIDLAKNVMQVCKVSRHGELISNKTVCPSKLRELLAKATPSVVAMGGCRACHYWARLAKRFGHEARIISPKNVKAFLQRQKTDANDALAFAMAATQFGMKFSLIKEEEQSMQTLETSRGFLRKELTALNNHIRAYVYEYGITIPRGHKGLKEAVIFVLDNSDTRLPTCLKSTF